MAGRKTKPSNPNEQAGDSAAARNQTGEETAQKAPAPNGGSDASNALPEPQINVVDLQVLRALIEEHGRQQLVAMQRLLQNDREQRAAQATVPLQPSPYDHDAIGRLLATTSEIRERGARTEVAVGDILRRVGFLEENQRPPEPTPDRDAAVRAGAIKWVVANYCRAANLLRPTPAIVGRVMHDERVFDRGATKSPQELFLGILNTVRRVFRLAVPQPNQESPAATEQDYVHLTEEMAAVIEDRSSRPKKKHSNFYDRELKRRLDLLVNSGLAEVVPKGVRNPPHYDRFLNPMGREVFDGWPEWDDRTGGISLAGEQMPPDPHAAGRPVIGATARPESQPSSQPPTSQPQPPSPT